MQHEVVKLHAEAHYPGLDFSSSTVDFYFVLNYTQTHKPITMTNCFLIPVSYCWAFLDDQRHSNIGYIYTTHY